MRGSTIFQSLLGLLLSTLLFLSAAVVAAPKTQRGIQCPTALVQSVTVLETYRTCCGHLATRQVTRKPKEGEKEFKQCRCAEKKAGKSDAESKGGDASASVTFALISPSIVVPKAAVLFLTEIVPFVAEDYTDLTYSPPIPPP